MRNKVLAMALGGLIALGAQAALCAQDQTAPPPDQQQGQGHGRRGMMNPDRQLEHMTKVLNLSADQQAQIKPILLDRQQKMQALWQDQSAAQQDRRAKMQAIRQDTDSRIEAVLNDQQKQQFESMHRGPRGGGEAPQGGAMQPQ
jgi:Spy/CpxP family protein refolding chaperone